VRFLRLVVLFANLLSLTVCAAVIVASVLFSGDLVRKWVTEPEDVYLTSALALLSVVAVICSAFNVRAAMTNNRWRGMLAVNSTVAATFILIGIADLSSVVSDSIWFFIASSPFATAAILGGRLR
jgi:membrane-associated HD superfamily phosphohydrolase